MKQQQVVPNTKTFAILIQTLLHTNYIDKAIKTYKMMEKYNLEPDTVINTMILQCYFENKEETKAFELFENMKKSYSPPENVAYSTLIRGCTRSGLTDDAMKYFNEMLQEGITPSYDDFRRVIRSLAYESRFSDAVSLLSTMKECNIPFTSEIFRIFSNRYFVEKQYKLVPTVFENMQKLNFKPDVKMFSDCIFECVKVGAYDIGIQLFDLAKNFDIELTDNDYSRAISCCDKLQNTDKLWEIWKEAKRNGYKVNPQCFFGAIFACTHSNPENIENLLNDMQLHNFQLQDSRQWTKLLGATTNESTSHPDIAFKIYYQMKKLGLKFDYITFAIMARVCFRANPPLLDDFEEVRNHMERLGIANDKFERLVRALAREAKNKIANKQ